MDIKTLRVEPGDTVILTFGRFADKNSINTYIKYFETVYPESHIVSNMEGYLDDITIIQYQGGGELDDYLL